MLKIIGAGLPRTGTTSLAAALRILGFKTLHYAPERLPLFPEPGQNWRVYDDVDAVLDIPASLFVEDIACAYDKCCPKIVLTFRNDGGWFESIAAHHEAILREGSVKQVEYMRQANTLMFGTPEPHEVWWNKRYDYHWATIEFAAKLNGYDMLVMNIVGGDGWDRLCPFLGVPIPDVPFPHENKRR